jgi:hypothetical protein
MIHEDVAREKRILIDANMFPVLSCPVLNSYLVRTVALLPDV